MTPNNRPDEIWRTPGQPLRLAAWDVAALPVLVGRAHWLLMCVWAPGRGVGLRRPAHPCWMGSFGSGFSPNGTGLSRNASTTWAGGGRGGKASLRVGRPLAGRVRRRDIGSEHGARRVATKTRRVLGSGCPARAAAVGHARRLVSSSRGDAIRRASLRPRRLRELHPDMRQGGGRGTKPPLGRMSVGGV